MNEPKFSKSPFMTPKLFEATENAVSRNYWSFYKHELSFLCHRNGPSDQLKLLHDARYKRI